MGQVQIDPQERQLPVILCNTLTNNCSLSMIASITNEDTGGGATWQNQGARVAEEASCR
jgi:hypothetical protein